jgi:hypothetical protein
MTTRFQFSIRFLLAATVAVSAGAAVASAERSTTTLFIAHCLTIIFATAAVVGVYQTSGNVRVVWLGTAIVLSPLAFWAVQMSVYLWPHIGKQQAMWGPGVYPVYDFWPVWCASPINGLLTVFGGMLFGERRERDRRDQEEQEEEAEFERKWKL